MKEVAAAAAPLSYALVLPPGWTRLPVGDGAGEAIGAVVESATAALPRDTAAPFRGELRKMLEAQVLAARATGGIDLYLPTEPMGGKPLAASFLVSHVGSGEGALSDEMVVSVLGELLTEDSAAEPVSVAGVTALRTHHQSPPHTAETDVPSIDRWSHRVDYTIPVPGGTGWLVIAFSTPVLNEADSPLSPDGTVRFDDVLIELFDAVVSTLQWRTS